MRWERVQLPSRQSQEGALQDVGEISGPGKRWGHTCNAIKEGRYLYVFGGYGRDNCQTNQVDVFDTAKLIWIQPEIKGIPPTPRDSHTCTAVGDNLYVFGGTDGMNPLKDLHILDTSSHTWLHPSVRGEGPEAREGHSAALVGKRLYIFGGCGKSSNNGDEVYYNDIYIFNTETFVWKRATTTGTPPSPRDSHTCSSWKNKVIVIGGEDAHDYYLSDVHILDTDTLIWMELKTSGQPLPPRAGHTTVAFGKNLFVFGGFTDAQNLYNDLYMLDIEFGVWTKVMTTGDVPSARFSVAGDSLDPQRNGILVFIGGCNKSLEALEDMYYLYTGLSRENERRLEKLSLRKQLKLKCQEQSLNSFHEKALVNIGTGADIYQHVTIQGDGHHGLNLPQHLQGKKTFHAKVTQSIFSGYTIETVIDGKPLHGILFAHKPNSNEVPITRKRSAEEAGGVMSNGEYIIKSKSSRVIQQDIDKQKDVDATHEKESLHEPEKESASTNLQDQAPLDASLPDKVTSNSKLSVPPTLDMEDTKMHDAPNSNSGIPEDDRTNDAPEFNTMKMQDALNLNSEVQGDDRTNDAPDSKTNVPKEDSSIADKNTVASSANLDDRTPAAELLGEEAAKTF